MIAALALASDPAGLLMKYVIGWSMIASVLVLYTARWRGWVAETDHLLALDALLICGTVGLMMELTNA